MNATAAVDSRPNFRTPVCERLGIDLPIFGFSPYQQALTGELLAAVEEHEVAPLIYEAAGQSVAWLRQEESVNDVISRIVRQMHRSWDELHAIG